MKRNLLRFVSVGEFSPLVEWKEPSASFVIRQLLCTICNKCNDVDICRDAVLSEDMVSWYVFMKRLIIYQGFSVTNIFMVLLA